LIIPFVDRVVFPLVEGTEYVSRCALNRVSNEYVDPYLLDGVVVTLNVEFSKLINYRVKICLEGVGYSLCLRYAPWYERMAFGSPVGGTKYGLASSM